MSHRFCVRHFLLLFVLLVGLWINPVCGRSATPTSAAAINAYLQKYNSPMAGLGETYMRWGQYFNVDPRLIVAISYAESSLGKNTSGTYNAWGWFLNGSFWRGFAAGIDTDTVSYTNAPNYVSGQGINMATGWEDGVFWDTKTLRKGYLDKNLTTVDAIAPVYCTDGTANWIANVKGSLTELGGDINQLSFPGTNTGGGGSSNGLPVPLFCQRADPWQSSLLGFSTTDTINRYGCVITDIAMVLDYYGANTNPGDINNWLKANGGYASQDLLVWSVAARHGPNVSYAGGNDWSSVPADLNVVNAELDAGYPVIANVCLFQTQSANHYVVLTGHSGTSTYYCNDPWDGQQHTIPDSRFSNGAAPSVAIWGIQKYHGTHSNPDTTPPTVTITSGQVSSGTYNTPQNVTWHISEDQSGIDHWGQAWDVDPGANTFTTDGGNLDLPVGTHVLHIHVRDKAGNDKDWTFGPYTYTPVKGVGQGSGGNVDQRYVDCYNRVGAAIVGSVDNNYVHTATGSFGNGGAQDFAGGSGGKNIIMAKDGAALAYDVRGSIWSKYSGMSFASSPLGFPTSDEETATPSPKGTSGYVSHFEQGVITSTSAGTFEVHGSIFSKYANLSGSGGVLGFPTQDAWINPGSMGRYGTSGNVQLFEGGGIFDSKYGVFFVSGAIWSSQILHIISGYYGYPVQDEQNASASPFGTSGRMIGFEAGAFYSTAQYSVHGVGGEIYKQYAAAQSSGGRYGFPTGDAYGWNGGTRQDFEGGYLTDGTTVTSSVTHVLWVNPNGAASLWNYDLAGGTFTQNSYGPYPGWAAKAVADGGTDGKTRLLWNNANGQMSLWSLDNSTGQFTQHTFGPYPGWTAKTISVGPDNTTHVLWASTSGAASVWNYSTDTSGFTQHSYGPYPGWVPVALADGANGKTRMIWGNYDGRESFWNLDSGSGSFTQNTFGPYPGWTANALSVSADGVTHIMWDDSTGRMSLWNYDSVGGGFTQHTSGPYSGWTAMGLASGSDGKMGLLWVSGGSASLWSYDVPSGGFSPFTFGPYGGWSAVGLSTAP